MREIAIRAGRGNISSSTVHNIFSRSQVPAWRLLEHVVKALDGAKEREVFLSLWEAAWRVENDVAPPRRASAGLALPQGHEKDAEQYPLRPGQRAPLVGGASRMEVMPRPAEPIWSSEIPSRNPNFTGRAAELERLGDNLFSGQLPQVQVISGMGGVGKTELAAEYIHRNIGAYKIIWWIPDAATLHKQAWSAGLRFFLAYLVLISAWVALLLVVGTRAEQEDPESCLSVSELSQ